MRRASRPSGRRRARHWRRCRQPAGWTTWRARPAGASSRPSPRSGTADAPVRGPADPHRAQRSRAAAASKRPSGWASAATPSHARSRNSASTTEAAAARDGSASADAPLQSISTTTGAWSLGRSFLRGSLVDAAGPDARPQGLADQDVVDAQALVLAEGQVAVVPPAPALGRLLEQPEGVVQAEPKQSFPKCARSSGVQWICPAQATGS
jgi:hypothetical protein